MSTACLNFEKVRKVAHYIQESRHPGELMVYFWIPIKTRTGKKSEVRFALRALQPDPEYPNHLLICEEHPQSKDRYPQQEKEFFEGLALSLPPIEFGKRTLAGIRIVEGDGGRDAYEHKLYEPIRIDEKPVISELYNRDLIGNPGKIQRDLRHIFHKHNYFKIDGYYYEGIGDPIKDAISGKTFEVKETAIDHMNEMIPFRGTDADWEYSFPVYFYKGYLPLLPFSDEIGFSRNLFSPFWEDYGKIIVPGTRGSDKFGTEAFDRWEEFMELNDHRDDLDWLQERMTFHRPAMFMSGSSN